MIAERCAALPLTTRRWIALCIVPLLLLGLGALLAWPFVLAADAQARWREDAIRTLGRAKYIQSVDAELQQMLVSLRTSNQWTRFYDARVSNASQAMQSDMRTLLGAAKASVQALTPLPSKDLPEFTQVGVRIAAIMRIDELQQLMQAMRDHPRYLRVVQMQVLAPQMQVKDENASLTVSLDVVGYVRELPAPSPADRPEAMASARGGQ